MGPAKQAVAARPTASLLRTSPRLWHPCAPGATCSCHTLGARGKLCRCLGRKGGAGEPSDVRGLLACFLACMSRPQLRYQHIQRWSSIYLGSSPDRCASLLSTSHSAFPSLQAAPSSAPSDVHR